MIHPAAQPAQAAATGGMKEEAVAADAAVARPTAETTQTNGGKATGGEEAIPQSGPAVSSWPPGWYDVSDRVNTRGYWDGQRWTGDFVPKGTLVSTPATAAVGVPAAKTGLVVALVGFVALAAGSVGPWVDATIASASGTDGDGKFTLITAGLGALTVLLARRGALFPALMALAGLGVSIYDIAHVSEKAQDLTVGGVQIAHVGWGLYVCAGGAGLALIGALIHHGALRSARPAVQSVG